MTMHPNCGVEPSDILYEGGELGFLLIHRIGGTSTELDYVASRLSAAGHTVLCPLLFGHGGSRALLGATTWQQWYLSVSKAHDVLKRSCSHQIVGGLSTGAALALLLAADCPDIDAAVLFAPTFSPVGWSWPLLGTAVRRSKSKVVANLFRMTEHEPYGIKDRELRAALIERLRQDGRSLGDIFGRTGGVLIETDLLAAELEPKLASIRQPTLIFHAREDDGRGSDIESYRLQQRLCGMTDVSVLDDTYHLVTADRQRDLVVERMLEFADLISAPPPRRPSAGTDRRSAQA